MATTAAVERFKAQGKQQLNVWIDGDVVAILKTLSVQRSQSYGDILRDALVSLHSGQPVAPVRPASDSSAIDAASVNRLASSVDGLNDEVALLGGNVRDYVETSDDRLSEIEARLQHLEATINSTPVLSIPVPQTSPETPVQPAPGGNEAPDKKQYNRAPDSEIEARRKLFMELHNAGKSTSQISHAVKAKGFNIGTSPGAVDIYLRSQGLTPHRMRG